MNYQHPLLTRSTIHGELPAPIVHEEHDEWIMSKKKNPGVLSMFHRSSSKSLRELRTARTRTTRRSKRSHSSHNVSFCRSVHSRTTSKNELRRDTSERCPTSE